MNGFQMLRMHQQAGKLIPIAFQPEQDAQTDVIDSALHGAVHCLGVVIVIMLWSCWMKLQIAFFMIRFLKQDICPDPCVLQLSVIFHRSCCDIDVYAADRSVFVLNRINRINTF